MYVAITGASGLVGSALVEFLAAEGHQVLRLVRRSAGAGEASWDPALGTADAAALEGVDAVVHLAGENIAARRWTAAQKDRIYRSRVEGTRFLAETLARLHRPPKVLASASAIGYYGDRGEEVLTEQSPPGEGFLAKTARDWEAAAQPAAEVGVRVVALRFGMILARQGGALAKMLTPFRLGVGGRVGHGRQSWSWIDRDDALAAIRFMLVTDHLRGPVNVVAPNPVTNLEFTKTLGRVLARPTWFPMPSFAARLALGEMADELLLCSTRVIPERLQANGFEWSHPTLEAALAHAIHQ